MNATGEVTAINGTVATVKFKRGKACKNCGACVSFSDDECAVELENTLNAAVGDLVIISLHSKSVVKASLIMYGVPLIALVAGVTLGNMLGETVSAVTGIAFALISYFILHLFEPRFARMGEFQPKMTGFCDKPE